MRFLRALRVVLIVAASGACGVLAGWVALYLVLAGLDRMSAIYFVRDYSDALVESAGLLAASSAILVLLVRWRP